LVGHQGTHALTADMPMPSVSYLLLTRCARIGVVGDLGMGAIGQRWDSPSLSAVKKRAKRLSLEMPKDPYKYF
jgi:hypothetical protein